MSRNVNINFDVYNQIRAKLEEAQHTSVVVGILGQTDSEVLQRAIYTEFGTRHMPSWRWLQKSVNRMKPDYKRIVGTVLIKLLNNQRPNYNAVGIWATGRVKDTIGRIRTPRLTAETIAIKGSSKPLINTGQMRNAVSFEIRRST